MRVPRRLDRWRLQRFAARSALAAVAVVGAPGDASVRSPQYPNQPAGFVKLVEGAWDALPPYPATAASGWWAGESMGNAAIVTDSTVPAAWRRVLVCHVPRDTHDGVGSCKVNHDDFTEGGGAYYPKLYVSAWVKHSRNWVPHPIGSKMFWFEHPTETCDGYSDVYSTFGGVAMRVGVVQQNCSATERYMYANVGDGAYHSAFNFLGWWQRYEFLLAMNTGSEANGTFRMWVDGHLVCEYLNVQWLRNDGAKHLWSGIRYHNVYGGRGGLSASQYEYLGHLYVSGGN